MKRRREKRSKVRRRETEPPSPTGEAPTGEASSEPATEKSKRVYRKAEEKEEIIRRVDAGESPESLGIKKSQVYQWRSDLKKQGRKRQAKKKNGPALRRSDDADPVSMGLLSSSLEAGAKALDARGTVPSELLTHDLLFLLARQKHLASG